MMLEKMRVKVYTLNAFAKTEDGGNPAGVVLASESDILSEEQMQLVAKKVGFSETAFVQKSDKVDFKLRFFTPELEVDLCGHATIAAFFLLAEKNTILPGKYAQETKAGVLNIEVKEDKTIFMNQTPPVFSEILDKREIADSLNILEEELADLPIQVVSTGLRDIIIPVKTLSILEKINPDFNKVTEISKRFNTVGYHVFTLETKSNSTAHVRNFAPLFGIPEEAATGTSNGALACYLFKYNIIDKEQAKNLIFEQGYLMKKPSEILANLTFKDNEIIEVKVGGIASNISSIDIEV